MNKNLIAVILFVVVPCLASCQEGRNDRGIIVTTATRSIDDTRPGQEICDSFVLTKENVVTYFSTAEEVDEYDFNQEAIIFPCKYNGALSIGGEKFSWELSAGGAGYLYRKKDVNKRYLCKTNCCDALPKLCS